MPFTLSHTAAILIFKPLLKKKKLSYTGLILGTMSPDFEYFLRMKMQGEIGHQLMGILLLNLPVSVMIALVFHLVIRDQLIEYSPKIIKKRFIVYQYQNWFIYFKQHFYIVMTSILLGIFTHILWDSFTHRTGFFVQSFAILHQNINVSGYSIHVYNILQHSSSALGLALILYFIYKMPTTHLEEVNPNFCNSLVYWLLISVFIAIFFTLWSQFNNQLVYSIGHIVVAFIASTFWSILFTALIFKFRKIKY